MSEMQLKKKHDGKLPTGLLSVALSPDESELLTGCFDGVYRVELPQDEDSERTEFVNEKLYSHGNYVSSVVWTRENVAISAGYDGVARWYDLGKKEEIRNVQLHDFWSWDMAVSPNGKHLASVTGQYLAGEYKYEPKPESEPSLKIVSVESGETIHSLPHIPSVQAVAVSPNGRYVAAGNLMGEVRVFDIEDGSMVSQFTTPDFTSWGIIKSHCYLGGIFAMQFSLTGEELLLAGMGPMRDPMAGNGKQLWQKWNWKESNKTGETNRGDSGEGLMEALAVHPSGDYFVMGGRLRGGQWNLAMFEMESGNKIAQLKTGFRVTDAVFSSAGHQLIVTGTKSQPQEMKNGEFGSYGRLAVYEVEPG